MKVEDTALFGYLARHTPEYRAKLIEVRDEVKLWLSYIPQTFPHYTQHTVEHSEAIISKLSKLLFHDEDAGRPVVQLTGVEVYILSAAAYLHDAGMVCSDHEKEEILRSDEWRNWTTGDGGGASRWREIESMRSAEPTDALRNFAADRQVRFLIAEFIRRRHHHRAADVIAQHHVALGRLDYGDDILRTTIADICVAHGLDKTELEDRERFPERREIRDAIVNVRFLASLLRIGDLLDMRHDRACSLLLAASCPLPADSYAHWTQYRRITHQLVAPDRIELRAECLKQEEHRFLYDWCSWLVDEIRFGAIMMARATRHHSWRAPQVSLGDGSADETIVIRPARTATYIPRKWQFELDASAIFQRLIRDVYEEPEAFLRELIQNALDAMRCQMYLDLNAKGHECPEYPTEVSSEWLARYELSITLETERLKNPLSGEEEEHQVLIVDDCGIGMDQDTIERYFLQVGRSYYTTDSFRRTFPFHPVSRFGVGFLAVFAVSDNVTIETLRTHGVASENPVRLTLTGPRGYLLAERAARNTAGTRIAVRLKEPFTPGRLLGLVRNWCRRVEFAIKVKEHGVEETITAEKSDKWECKVIDPVDAGATLAVRSIPIVERGIQGELYVIARITGRGESWANAYRVRRYRQNYPFASLPMKFERYICQQGLLRYASETDNFGYRLDNRRLIDRDVMDRASRQDRRNSLQGSRKSTDDMLAQAWWVAITHHLENTAHAKGELGWRYAHQLAREHPALWWPRVPKTVPVWIRGSMVRQSVESLVKLDNFTTVCGSLEFTKNHKAIFPVDPASRQAAADIDGPVLFSDDLDWFDAQLLAPLFAGRRASNVRWLTSTALILNWTTSADMPDTCEYSDPSIIAVMIHGRMRSGGYDYILNTNNALVRWANRARRQSVPGSDVFWESLAEARHLDETRHLLQQYLAAHVEHPPPNVQLTESCYLDTRLRMRALRGRG
jgi:molecular chaperone HtpG